MGHPSSVVRTKFTNRMIGGMNSANGEVAELVGRMRQGDVRALARAVSLVENDAPSARQILSCCFPYSGSAMRIGITGSPGAGKSTLVDGLARRYRAQQATVGVVAVDPTSPYTGGAILGDRIRMREHDADPGFYMRSMATRGSLGGLARSSADVAVVIEASGKQRLLLETVGVGQDEIDIVRLADVTVVVLVPGMGDDVQSLKAGIMEIADIFVVNKSDRDGADRVEKEVRSMQSLACATRKLDSARGPNHRHHWRRHRRAGTGGGQILVMAGRGGKAYRPAGGALAGPSDGNGAS